ncbi:MAG TPA: hypothetical protein VKE88_00585, partial [Candidatus Nanoarchaeia archaeon]|nr:hypothetical protein [Candidatus Nanoarchaeia archaeon]
QSFQGKRDYVTYGRKAPAIVQAIRARSDAPTIWQEVYGRLKEITTTISQSYAEGHKQYKELVLGLESQFLKTA